METIVKEERVIDKITLLDEKELSVYYNIQSRVSGMLHVYKKMSRSNPDTNHLLYQSKGESRSEFGYYHSYNSKGIIEIIKHYGIKSMADLGSGPGALLHLLDNYFAGKRRFDGYEIEKALVKDAAIFDAKVYEKDILKLTKINVSKYEAVYFYEPFTASIYPDVTKFSNSIDNPKAKQFVDNLIKILKPGQYVLYSPAGLIMKYIIESDRFEQLARHEGVVVYRFKAKTRKINLKQ